MATLDEIRQVFFVECDEQLETLTDGLGELHPEADAGEVSETINAMFRAVHSIKGGAASFGLDALTSFAHAFESVLDDLRLGHISVSSELVREFYRASDHLADLVTGGGTGAETDEAILNQMISSILAMGIDKSNEPDSSEMSPESFGFQPIMLDFPGVEPSEEAYQIKFSPTRALYDLGHEPVHLFRELASMGDLETEAILPELQENDGLMSWRLRLVTTAAPQELWDVFDFVGELAAISVDVEDANRSDPEPDPDGPPDSTSVDDNSVDKDEKPSTPEVSRKAPPQKTTLRVDLDLVDSLINLVGELVINQSVLAQSVAETQFSEATRIDQALEELKTLSRQIQEGVMNLRAQSVKPLFQRMARIVRETADIAGKNVILTTEGESTEVDRTVVEHLVDPLTHILRNSIDHGIEDAQTRKGRGKPLEGHLRLSAVHRSGRVFIDISDDGGGVNRERVLSKAVEKGLVSPDATLSPADIDRLLFTPGFSTAEAVTNLSGRGVGMDVVNREIQKLGGRISITSEPGAGTTISISLPLTLAVLDGMVVDVAGQTLVIPISAIVETIRPEEAKLSHVGPRSKMVNVRDVLIPIIELSDVFSFGNSNRPPTERVLLLVETENQALTAFAVDRIYDQRQVVIKSLENNYGRVPGIAAATILGDGKIALIVDPDEITSNPANSHDTSSVGVKKKALS
ncbi:two-component system, chemotaxis family, sensor kinase CheA [Palleronia marisminoris]|uniref:Chemotaxis protein CheA n=1 Tax=Palleronia marisminoris TaxID=315423 RepID=A0A1Y5RE22_9RHOB|nr:chemotaxis protein CheA [Palleronia marisminoris]SFG14353.1 two-component system, chemotaxis family, sensor kinase CheA [Palleronia marisminoris]SLN15054.1 Chemotaxis protein CheA [Palleronia marisminoris]